MHFAFHRFHLVFAALFMWAISAAGFAAERPIVLRGAVRIRCEANWPAVRLAVDDLAADFGRVLGTPGKLAEADQPADIVVEVDPTLGGDERWVRHVAGRRVTVTGSDPLGAVYGVYAFSKSILGVDPLWYWKDLPPEPRETLLVEPGRTESVQPIFRYRGWFVNDEDLLTEWKEPAGPRHIRYPYYDQVISLEVADRIFEALLRSGGNLIIPASFVDVMNPPEAELVRRAAERGLYVSQHHIEPLGVSHFGFENYWRSRGLDESFSYGDAPDRVRQAWRAFAQRWNDLAGDRVVWQLGLRGKGDRSIWHSDPSVGRDEAGHAISRAIAEQWDIVREIDPRPVPPATTTLWAEGSELMSEGSLSFPEDVTIVFADEGTTQQMQDDFRSAPREPHRQYGVYYHVGYWSRGSHLLQGTTPRRVGAVFDEVIAQGDTQYAIINVCNIREHVLGVEASMAAMRGPYDAAQFMRDWSPPCLHESYRMFLDSLIRIEPNRVLQDGAVFQAIRGYTRDLAEGRPIRGGAPIETFDRAIESLDRVIAEYPADRIPPRMREFYDVNLLTQARMWRALLTCVRALKQSSADRAHLQEAVEALEEFLAVRERAVQGRWKNWYRGDKKVNTPEILRRLREVAE